MCPSSLPHLTLLSSTCHSNLCTWINYCWIPSSCKLQWVRALFGSAFKPRRLKRCLMSSNMDGCDRWMDGTSQYLYWECCCLLIVSLAFAISLALSFLSLLLLPRHSLFQKDILRSAIWGLTRFLIRAGWKQYKEEPRTKPGVQPP